MSLTLYDDEREIIEVLLWYSNLKPIQSTEQIESRFQKLHLVPGYFRIISYNDVEIYKKEQEELKLWLTLLCSDVNGYEGLEKLISSRWTLLIDSRISFTNGQLHYQYGFTSVQAVCIFGIALLLDKQRGLHMRIRQCENKECGAFKLDFKPRGRPRKFCNEYCKHMKATRAAAEHIDRRKKRSKVDRNSGTN